MLLVTFRFITHVAWMQHTLVKNDPEARTLRSRFKAAWTLWGHPGYFRKLAPAWLDYFRPGFHPWDRDVEAALERARAKLGYDPHGRETSSRENPPKAA
jgi:predicted metal-dependent hydrolase